MTDLNELEEKAKEIKENLDEFLEALQEYEADGEISDELDITTANNFMLARVSRKIVVGYEDGYEEEKE